MFNQILRPIVRNMARNGTRSATSDCKQKAVDFKLPSFDEVPAPQGCWKEHYDARQKVYNIQLIGGVSALIATIAFVKFSGIIFFNFGPPKESDE